MQKIATLLLLAVIAAPTLVYGDKIVRDPLFHIERNKNANIIQYDAQLGPDGMLLPGAPVVGYWIRLADQGEIKELTWVQKKFAYGFTTKLNKKDNTVTLEMAADLGRTILVKRDGEDYRATANINGKESFVEKIFIHASGSGISTKVEYIELFGRAVNDQSSQFERFSP